MKVCVVGAGAIGGLLAVRLAKADHEVSVVARGANLVAIRSRGMTLFEPDGSVLTVEDLQASDDLATLGAQDLVVLALKAHQIRQVAEQLPVLFGAETVVLPLQNGIPWWFFQRFPGEFEGRRLHTLDPEGRLERQIPAERILGSIAYPAVERDAPGMVRVIEGDRFPVGELSGERSERANAIAGTLTEAGFKSRVLSDIRAHLWIKAWGNLAFNPISALTRASLGEVTRFSATRVLAERMMLEAGEIAEKLGLHLRLSVEQRIDGAEKVGEHKTSMLQDLEAGRALEIDALVGVFIELGQLTATPTPAIDCVYRLVALLNALQPEVTAAP
jgi:2-dehydropantoate 2-reductase